MKVPSTNVVTARAECDNESTTVSVGALGATLRALVTADLVNLLVPRSPPFASLSPCHPLLSARNLSQTHASILLALLLFGAPFPQHFFPASVDVRAKLVDNERCRTSTPARAAVGHSSTPGEVGVAAEPGTTTSSATSTSPYSSANGRVARCGGVGVVAKPGGKRQSATSTPPSEPPALFRRGAVGVATEIVTKESSATSTATAFSFWIGLLPIHFHAIGRLHAFLNLAGSRTNRMHARLLLLLLVSFLGLPILLPPGDDALSRARKQAHPSAGRAVSLVRDSRVQVAALASRPQVGADDDGEGVRVQEEAAAPCRS